MNTIDTTIKNHLMGQFDFVKDLSYDEGYCFKCSSKERKYFGTMYNIFVSEYGYFINKIGFRNALIEWIKGLPSCVDVPIYNGEVIEFIEKHELKISYLKFFDHVGLSISNIFQDLKIVEEI